MQLNEKMMVLEVVMIVGFVSSQTYRDNEAIHNGNWQLLYVDWYFF